MTREALSALESHPVLVPLLKRIAQQETKHVAFYASQARDRLAASKKARVVARLALERAWGPVGSGVMPETEVAHVMTHLFAGSEGRKLIRDIDARIAKLPGLDGLHIVEDAMGSRGIAS
ncbi:hypothetical protein [Streptomyces sp. NPDC001980]|uniref:hypothetical protein n=1 Tax=Streptomyces sp. NPDC001980 TaxID=3157126 RepID=UPI00331BCEA0